jgi:hypothetical protein
MRNLQCLATVLTIGALLAGCGNGSESSDPTPSDIPQTYAVSECGGFLEKASLLKVTPPPQSYCDAEVLSWAYDQASGTLTFSNNRIQLNCCGERTVSLFKRNGEYVISEKDAPEQIMTPTGPSGARCDCMCVFDLAVQGETIRTQGGVVKVRLVRDVTDSNEPAQTLFAGKIDLSEGSGTIVIDSSPVGLDASDRCPPLR